MEIRCIRDEWYIFSPRIVREGREERTVFNGISIGIHYKVYGMMLYEEGIYYLIFDNFKMPNWYPADLFHNLSNLIPNQWYYKYYGHDESLNAIWGYFELVNTDKHFDGLGEQEQEEIAIFLRRKEEMDK